MSPIIFSLAETIALRPEGQQARGDQGARSVRFMRMGVFGSSIQCNWDRRYVDAAKIRCQLFKLTLLRSPTQRVDEGGLTGFHQRWIVKNTGYRVCNSHIDSTIDSIQFFCINKE